MSTFVVVNQKGGVGKSTTTVNLAASLCDVVNGPGGGSEDSPVLVASADPQGSAVWWADRVAELGELPFNVGQVDSEGVIPRLPLIPGTEHVFIDTPGWIGDTIDRSDKAGRILTEALETADLAIVPITPQALSFRPTARTIKEVLEPMGVPYLVVINMWDPRDGKADLEETQKFVRGEEWPLANTVLRQYKVHAKAALHGLLVNEYKKTGTAAHAASDFQKLTLEIINIANSAKPRVVQMAGGN